MYCLCVCLYFYIVVSYNEWFFFLLVMTVAYSQSHIQQLLNKNMLYYQADYRTLYLQFRQLKDSFIPKYLKIMLFPTSIIFVTDVRHWQVLVTLHIYSLFLVYVLCYTEKKNDRFGTTWRWVNDDRFSLLGELFFKCQSFFNSSFVQCPY